MRHFDIFLPITYYYEHALLLSSRNNQYVRSSTNNFGIALFYTIRTSTLLHDFKEIEDNAQEVKKVQ